MQKVGERIKEFRKIKGIKATQIAETVQISSGYLSDIESGRTSPSVDTLLRIAEALDISISRLLGEPEEPKSEEGVKKMFEWFAKHSDDVPTNMIGLCLKHPDLVPPKWDVQKAISKLNKTNHPLPPQPKRDFDLVQIPVLSREQTACCGGGIVALDITSDPEDVISVPRSMLGTIDQYRPPFAQRTNGSSMKTYGIASESIVVINPAEEVTSGNVALVCMGDKQTVKKIIFRPQTIELLSDGQPITVEKEDFEAGWFRILGKIVAIFSQPNHSL